MNRQQHPIWEDELMPFLDGQLDAAQAAGIAEHLENCEDCAASVAETRRLSQQVTAWKVEDVSEQLTSRVFAELRIQNGKKVLNEKNSWWTMRRVWAFGLTGVLATFVLAVLVTARYGGKASFDRSELELQPYVASSPSAAPPAEHGQHLEGDKELQEVMATSMMAKVTGEPRELTPSYVCPTGPMIIRSARLRIIAKDFEGARAKLEAIVQQSQGYLDQMTVKGESGTGRVLSATLRMPSNRLDTALIDVRKLGRIQEESQNSSEITSQYVDLSARLTNARNSESRLQGILKERTGKLSDVVDLEREISRVREDIERMEAEQKELNSKVQYASIQIEMSEEYHAQLVPSVPSAATSLWNATVDGYHTAMDSLLGLALFLLRYGPALILWAALLLPIALFVRHRRRLVSPS